MKSCLVVVYFSSICRSIYVVSTDGRSVDILAPSKLVHRFNIEKSYYMKMLIVAVKLSMVPWFYLFYEVYIQILSILLDFFIAVLIIINIPYKSLKRVHAFSLDTALTSSRAYHWEGSMTFPFGVAANPQSTRPLIPKPLIKQLARNNVLNAFLLHWYVSDFTRPPFRCPTPWPEYSP